MHKTPSCYRSRFGRIARFALFIAMLAVPTALSGQSIVTISPQQCVWHPGDNLAWAAPDLDDSSWQPWQDWKPDFAHPHLWIRCRFDPAFLRNESQPSLQISSYSAYQLYLNGVRIGAEGNLSDGNSSLNAVRSYPAPSRLLASRPSIVALRITNRITLSNSGPFLAIVQHPLEIRAGNGSLLDAVRAQTVSARAARFIPTAVDFGIVGVLALVLLGLFFYDRTRHELLFLSVACLALAMLRINELAAASMLNYSVSAGIVILSLGNIGMTVTEVPFFYALARRRIPRPVLVLLWAMAAAYIPAWMDGLWSANQPVWMGTFNTEFLRPFALLSHFAISFIPFFVFGPWKAVPRRMRPLAILCMIWGAADIVWFAVETTVLPFPGMPNLFAHWGLDLLASRAFSTACVLAALLFLLFREQRQVTENRALLAGELHAACEIQQMLAPAKIDCAAGLHIEVAFHPMREVGGDFYLCRILRNRRQRLLVGDVSGKGAAAAMAATLILGAAAARDSDSPSELLTQVSRVLSQSRVGGFATCLCADIAEDGLVTIANAGHLAPYRNGEEAPIDNGLPLGVTPHTTYSESTLRLSVGDQLTFLSDGVVEAQSPTRELFGFDRTAQISTQSAEAIAQAAQQFGQEDDITVLTLQFAPVEVLHA